MTDSEVVGNEQDQGNVEQAPPAEKMVPQSEVNRIVKSRMAAAAEKARKEVMEQMQAQQQAQSPQQPQEQQYSAASMGGMPQMSQDQIRQMIADESRKQTEQSMAQQVAREFGQKMDAGKQKYPDFDETVAALNLPSIPHIVHWANGLDNTADVMYEIAQNPAKFSNLLTLSAVSPSLAQKELGKLSQSIKTNQAATNAPAIPEPLSEVKPSTIGTDSGQLTVRDFKKRYRG